MTRKWRLWACWLVGLAFVLAALLFIRLADFETDGAAAQRPLSFTSAGHTLQGTLILPPGRTSPAVAVIVHGDGPQDRWSNGGYLPLVNALLARGIGVFSWDKPGVGGSGGNWLAQTMSDRASEAAEAVNLLRQQPGLSASRIGFLGFSQAGWVVPQASRIAPAEFVVLVGPAIDWREQGLWFMRQRLSAEGVATREVDRQLAQEQADVEQTFTPQRIALPCAAACTREDFERRNADANALPDIRRMTVPVMVLMGEDDRNVDPWNTLPLWRSFAPPATRHCIRSVEHASHGLLRSRWFNYQLESDWPGWKQGLFLLLGRYAYAPGAIDGIAGWINGQRC